MQTPKVPSTMSKIGFWEIMFWGIGALALILTVYATGLGLQSFMQGAIGLMLAALGVGFLIVASYFLGQAVVSRNWMRAIAILPFYLLCVGYCWFFSYASYSDAFAQNSGGAVVSAEADLRGMFSKTEDLAAVVEDHRLEVRSKVLADGHPVADYLASLATLVAALGDPIRRDEIKGKLDIVRKARVDGARTTRDDRAEGVRTSQRTLEGLTQQRAEAQANADEIAEQIQRLEARIPRLKAALIAEDTGEGVELVNGRLPPSDLFDAGPCTISRSIGRSSRPGTCYVAIEDSFAAAVAEMERLTPAQINSRETLDRLNQQVSDAKIDFEAQSQRLQEARDEVARLDQTPAQSLAAADEMQGALNALRDTPTSKNMERLSQLCATLQGSLTESGVQDLPSCTSAAANTTIVEYDQLLARINGFKEVREQTGETFEALVEDYRTAARSNDSGVNEGALNVAFDAFRRDVMDVRVAAARAAGATVDDLVDGLQADLSANDPSLNRLDLALADASDVIKFEKPARDMFPAITALLQEAALLFVKIFTDLAAARRNAGLRLDLDIDLRISEDDTQMVQAAKHLVVRGEPADSGRRYRAGYDTDISPDVRANMETIVSNLRRERLAMTAFWHNDLIVLREGIDKLRQLIVDAQVAARRAADPIPTIPVTTASPPPETRVDLPIEMDRDDFDDALYPVTGQPVAGHRDARYGGNAGKSGVAQGRSQTPNQNAEPARESVVPDQTAERPEQPRRKGLRPVVIPLHRKGKT